MRRQKHLATRFPLDSGRVLENHRPFAVADLGSRIQMSVESRLRQIQPSHPHRHFVAADMGVELDVSQPVSAPKRAGTVTGSGRIERIKRFSCHPKKHLADPLGVQ